MTVGSEVGAAWRLTLRLMRRLPQAALSRGFGRLADSPLPRWLRPAVLGGFARTLGEAERPLTDYGSVGELFVRRLRAGARVWPQRAEDVASPVDGVLGRHGRIREGRALQAKGLDYSIAELLDDEAQAAAFDGGEYLTIYLSPRHYHRIHTPCPGEIRLARHVPGALMPVNAAAVAGVEALFPRNERLICYLQGPVGRVAVVAVGAYNVGRITAEFEKLPRRGSAAERPPLSQRALERDEDLWATNTPRVSAAARTYEPPIAVAHGDEIMAFRLGSTVVLLFEAGAVEPEATLEAGAELRVGEIIARGRGRS